MGDVATETKARYCTECQYVNVGATWTESVYTYPGRSDDMLAEGEAQLEAATQVAIPCGMIRSQPSP